MGDLKQPDLFTEKRRSGRREPDTFKLVTYFYKILSGKRDRNINSINQSMDLSLSKKFLKVIKEELGIFPTEALEVAQEMIYDLITNEKDFKLKFPISNLGILGQAKLRFITEELFRRRKLKEMDDTPENFDELYEQSLLKEKKDYKYDLNEMLEDE